MRPTAAQPLYAYCHGFLSGPASSKGRHLRSVLLRHGVDLHLLDLNGGGGPADLTPACALLAIDAFWTAHGGAPLRLLGSSFGGWAAARYSELHPGRVERMLLLAPGFELASRWSSIIGADGVAAWRREGAREFIVPASGAVVSIPYAFAEAVERDVSPPKITVPTTCVHALRDHVVTLGACERAVARSCGAAELVVVDDDHALTAPATLDEITRQAKRRFSLCP